MEFHSICLKYEAPIVSPESELPVAVIVLPIPAHILLIAYTAFDNVATEFAEPLTELVIVIPPILLTY